jgi:hypothetical protein
MISSGDSGLAIRILVGLRIAVGDERDPHELSCDAGHEHPVGRDGLGIDVALDEVGVPLEERGGIAPPSEMGGARDPGIKPRRREQLPEGGH